MKRLLFTALCVVLCPLLILAQTRQITGTVLDGTTKNGVISATLSVKNSKATTITNDQGKFSLNAPSGAFKLVISSVGYESTEVNVAAGESTANVSLTVANSELTAVVVTALGITKQSKKLGYAVTTVSGDLLNKARENNLANSLTGRVAGLKVSGTSSGPGGTVKLFLRGNPGINGTGQPLFVINGVPMDNTQRGSAGEWGGADAGDGIGNLNPDDVETMTVLKGQSASALYGARASNGVILITTKTAKKGEFAVDYNMNYMVEKAMDNTDFQYVYGQGSRGLKPVSASNAQENARMSWGAKLDGSSVIQFDGKSYPYSAVKDNVKNFYRTAPSITNTVAVSKGGADGSFRLSMSTLNGDAIIRNSGLSRNTVNLNVTQNITSKLTADVVVNYIDQLVKNAPYLSDGPLNANNGLFLANNIDQKTLAPGYDPATGFESQFSDDEYVSNPWFVVNQLRNDVARKRFITSAKLKYNITSWLYAQGRVGYDLSNDRNFSVTPWGTAYSQGRAGGLNGIGKSERSELNVDALIGGNRKLVSDLSLDFAVGASLLKRQEEVVATGGGPFVLPYLYSTSNVLNFNRSYGFNRSEVHSAYYTMDFSYKNFLTIGTTGRYDAYSTLPINNNSIFVPSVTASFIFSELVKIEAISFGKLRASYATTSNELAQPYQTQLYYSLGNAYNGIPVGSSPTNLPSGLLKPFTTTELEIGTDLKMFGNRLSIDVAYFTKKSKNEIIPASFSIATGFNSGFIPTGSIQNKGLELQLSARAVQNKNFSWTPSFNLTSVSNKVLATDDNGNSQQLGYNRATLGNAFTAYVVGQSGPQIMAFDYKYNKGNIVVDGSGLPLRGDLVPMGGVLPTLFGGLNNEFVFKNLITFSFLVDYNYGNSILSATSFYSLRRGLNQQTLVGREGGITTGVIEGGAVNTKNASAQDYYRAMAQNVTKVHVLDGDFIKLRQVVLGISIPKNIVQKLKIFESMQLSFVARNLLILMKKSDNIDPEATFGSNIRYAGIEGTSLPTTRSYGLNLNVRFKK